jgi:molybdopterin-guanine dinucleotide biosynthesis adapter protein
MRVFGFAGWSGSGKTTLIEQILPFLLIQGLRVATVKHVHHAVDLDTPGKDSWRHRTAGASQVALVSRARMALLRETPAAEASLSDVLATMASADLVLVEGYKHHPIPKIEVHRRARGGDWLYREDPHVIALATDATPQNAPPVYALQDIEGMCALIRARAAEYT